MPENVSSKVVPGEMRLENYQDLCDIIRAVENRDAEQAKKFTRKHVKRLNTYTKQRAQEEGD
jgi:DNA-binding GntR family transcriptional regulator